MHDNKIFILALDGVPYTFLKKRIESGTMPHFEGLAAAGHFKAMDSVQPPVSSVAWASFLTGKLPHEHGILSFTERDPATMDWFIPDARYLKTRTIIDKLNDAGKHIFIMNVPLTYPAKAINGISICGFLGTDLRKGVYPPEEAEYLIKKNYKIDADTELAKKDLSAFLLELIHVLEKRIDTMWHYFERQPWDFFMTHIMETDRLFHFTWDMMHNGDPFITSYYDSFFKKLDDLLAKILERIDRHTTLLLLSDHGFTALRQEVYLNRWLWENEFLRFTRPVPQTLKDIHPDSKAYALYPGRIFINLRGRERTGTVIPGGEYEAVRTELAGKLSGLIFPPDRQKVIKEIQPGEKLYPGSTIPSDTVADLFALAHDGYDLKGQIWNRQLFQKTVFNGMHSFENAFILTNSRQSADSITSITHVEKFICRVLNI